jgi:D-tyrosyl-tRNA(Tyr) deacylase
MKALLQRVSGASVTVNSECVGEIEQGLLVLLGLDRGDNRAAADRMVDKLLAYRLFADGQGRMNCSVVDVHGGVLLVSQFTLSADTSKGLRPSFSSALPPTEAAPLYDYILSQLQHRHPHVAAGVFGADMQVTLVNDGPVTFLLEV